MEKIETDFRKQTERWDREFWSFFTIKAQRTEANEAVHDGFKEFCKLETDDNYTQGLRKLLEYYQEDAKFTAMIDKIQELEMRISQVETSKDKANEIKEDENVAF